MNLIEKAGVQCGLFHITLCLSLDEMCAGRNSTLKDHILFLSLLNLLKLDDDKVQIHS